MADKGFRSIEVLFINRVDATWSVESTSADDAWIDGEEPTPGQNIPQRADLSWGATTNDGQGQAHMKVDLTGLGSLTITATNDANGKSSVQVVASDVSHDVKPSEYNTKNHTQFTVTVTPK